MQLRKQPYKPFWRDPAHAPERGLKKSFMAIASCVAVLMLAVPPTKGYDEPISLQMAAHDPAAWICFIFMLGALGYFAARAWGREHHLTSLACGAMCLCLAAIAVTNPFSSGHLGAFTALVLIMGCMHWGLWWSHENAKLFALAALATGAAALCVVSLGYGERLLVIASTAAINVVFYEHISY